MNGSVDNTYRIAFLGYKEAAWSA